MRNNPLPRVTRLFIRQGVMPVVAIAAVAASADAQTYTVQAPITAPNFGSVAAATNSVTTFRNNGSVSVVSGSGAAVSSSVTRGVVTIRCVDGAGIPRRCSTASNRARVTVGTNGSPTGRAQALSSFTAVAGTGVTLTGTTTGSSLDFVMSGWTATSQDRTFYIDVNMPILGDLATTATTASAGFSVKTALNPTTPTLGENQTATATVRRSTRVTKVLDVAFGTIVLPAKIGNVAQTGTVTVSVTDPVVPTSDRVAGGASSPGLMGAAYSGGLFRLSAEPGTTFSLTAPTGVTMTNGGNNLLVALVPSKASGSHTMPPGGIDLTYTATVTVNSDTASGIYNGSFQVSIAYN